MSPDSDRGCERGSAPVEFLLVGIVLTALTLAVVQLALAIYVRNVVHAAAVDGAHRAALADSVPQDGVMHTSSLIEAAVGGTYAQDIHVAMTDALGAPTVEVTVRAALPVIGLIGVPGTLEVTGRALRESFDAEPAP